MRSRSAWVGMGPYMSEMSYISYEGSIAGKLAGGVGACHQQITLSHHSLLLTAGQLEAQLYHVPRAQQAGQEAAHSRLAGGQRSTRPGPCTFPCPRCEPCPRSYS